MSKRLQVLLPDAEWRRLQRFARSQGLTLSDWVRRTLRHEVDHRSTGNPQEKLAAVRVAATHRFPTADIEDMLAEIESGYLDTGR